MDDICTMEKIFLCSDNSFQPQFIFGEMFRLLQQYPIEAHYGDVYHDATILAFIFAGKYDAKYSWVIRNYGTHFFNINESGNRFIFKEFIARFEIDFDFINKHGSIYFIEYGNQSK